MEYKFPIIEKTLYEKVKINIIPDLEKNQTFLLPERDVIGVNINEMKYFYIENTKSRISLTKSMNLVTVPIVRSALTDGDCVTDTIFKRSTQKVCK